jgi:hypothetical protein
MAAVLFQRAHQLPGMPDMASLALMVLLASQIPGATGRPALAEVPLPLEGPTVALSTMASRPQPLRTVEGKMAISPHNLLWPDASACTYAYGHVHCMLE